MTQEAGMQAQARVFDLEPDPSRSAPDNATAAPAGGGSRALVPVQPSRAGMRRDTSRYPSATFLAHLIAVDRRVPQMRTRARAAPQDAVAVYSAALTGPPVRLGRNLRRSA
jgi:hypothetical protein